MYDVDNGDLDEKSSQSFIVKLWLEETREESGSAKWRGRFQAVGAGQPKYFEKLMDILLFMTPYLERMDVRLPGWLRLARWLRRPFAEPGE